MLSLQSYRTAYEDGTNGNDWAAEQILEEWFAYAGILVLTSQLRGRDWQVGLEQNAAGWQCDEKLRSNSMANKQGRIPCQALVSVHQDSSLELGLCTAVLLS